MMQEEAGLQDAAKRRAFENKLLEMISTSLEGSSVQSPTAWLEWRIDVDFAVEFGGRCSAID